MPTSAKLIKKNINPSTKKNLFLTHSSHFQPALDELKCCQNFYILKIISLEMKQQNHQQLCPHHRTFFRRPRLLIMQQIRNPSITSRKQQPVLKTCNVSDNFFSVGMSNRQFEIILNSVDSQISDKLTGNYTDKWLMKQKNDR